MVRLTSCILLYPTTQYFDPRPPSLSMLFINYFSNKHLLSSVPRVWAFFSHTFCTFISFGCGPSPLAQICFMAWQEGPFEVTGALGGGMKAGKTSQRHLSLSPDRSLFSLDCDVHETFMFHLDKTEQLRPNTGEVKEENWADWTSLLIAHVTPPFLSSTTLILVFFFSFYNSLHSESIYVQVVSKVF